MYVYSDYRSVLLPTLPKLFSQCYPIALGKLGNLDSNKEIQPQRDVVETALHYVCASVSNYNIFWRYE